MEPLWNDGQTALGQKQAVHTDVECQTEKGTKMRKILNMLTARNIMIGLVIGLNLVAMVTGDEALMKAAMALFDAIA